jgi:hypothetical protein
LNEVAETLSSTEYKNCTIQLSSVLEKGRGFFCTISSRPPLSEGGTMAKNDRFVVKHEEGWAVKKAKAVRASSVHETQREAEKRAKEIVENLGGGEVRLQGKGDPSEISTRRRAAMIRTRRVTPGTDILRSPGNVL